MSSTPQFPINQPLVIEGEFSIYRVAELRQMLLAALQAGGAVEVNLAGVTEMDSAGVQLLMSARKSLQAVGCELRLVEHSPAVMEVFDTLDLAAHFGDPLLVPVVVH